MNILAAERAVLDRALPGLDGWLAKLGHVAAEDPESQVIEEFGKAGGGNILIPERFGGNGLSCLEGVRLQRAVGSRAPSLAVATTMHHYKVAWLAQVLDSGEADRVLTDIVSRRHLVASCGAEGRSGKQLFAPGIEVSPAEGGLLISGTKRPCSLVRSMGLLTLLAPGPEGSPYAGRLLIVMVPADAPGLTWEPLWGNRVLRAAQTDAVLLDRVHVPDHRIVPLGDPDRSLPRLNSLMLLFLPLITAAYLGIATGQVERLFLEGRGAAVDRLAALGPLETASAAVEALASEVDSGPHDEMLLGRMLLVRYAAQRAIAEATDRVLELLGGMSFVTSGDNVDLLAASRALAFHPPAENAMRERLDDWLNGGGLTLV
ncbi:acyl-CoA dehydrogenase family protein [Streptomyces sp. NPDC052101]|uniref:acyl-CoA dehydrogenase family protein n=1 Tax=Streptomyces sp. NPDC052101 TaxID=3155763 RepID=UPI0034175F76